MKKLAAVSLAFMLPALVCAGDSDKSQAQADNERVYEIADVAKPPRLTRQVNPDYSKARGVRIKGSVEIGAIISSQGVPKEVRVVQGLNPEVDRSAVDAIKQWRFLPAEKDGRPVSVKVNIELEFHPM